MSRADDDTAQGITRDLTNPALVAEGVDLEAGRKEPIFENVEIPEHFGPVHVVVDDHKIKRFAFTQDDYHPWHLSGGAPFGHRIGHAALLANDLLQMFTTRYAASRTVGLHTEEQLWFDNAVRLGERVSLEGAYVEAYQKRGEGYVVLEAQATGEGNRSLLRHRGVEILRTVPGGLVGRKSAARTGDRHVTGTYDLDAPIVRTAGSGMAVGMPLRPMGKVITQEQASVFSRAGEYVRNIHDDLDVARRGGLRIPIVQGQQQCCLVAELLTQVFGAAWFTSGWLRVKFIQPVEVFEPLVLGGVITGIDSGDAHGHAAVDLEVWVRGGDGRLSTVGWAQCGAAAMGRLAELDQAQQAGSCETAS